MATDELPDAHPGGDGGIAAAEAWARNVLNRPDQVHVADSAALRTLLGEIRGQRDRLAEDPSR